MVAIFPIALYLYLGYTTGIGYAIFFKFCCGCVLLFSGFCYYTILTVDVLFYFYILSPFGANFNPFLLQFSMKMP